MTQYESVLETRDLGPGHSREVRIDGRSVLVLNIAQIYYALESRCPDSGTTLELRPSPGDDRLVCPADEAEYAVPTGERLNGPGRPLRRYDVRVEGNHIKIGPPVT